MYAPTLCHIRPCHSSFLGGQSRYLSNDPSQPRSCEGKLRNRLMHALNGNMIQNTGEADASDPAPTASSAEYDQLVEHQVTLGELYVFISARLYAARVQPFYSNEGHTCKSAASQFFLFSLRSRISTMSLAALINPNGVHTWLDDVISNAVDIADVHLESLTPWDWWNFPFLCALNCDDYNEFRHMRIHRWRPSSPPFPFHSYQIPLPLAVDLNGD